MLLRRFREWHRLGSFVFIRHPQERGTSELGIPFYYLSEDKCRSLTEALHYIRASIPDSRSTAPFFAHKKTEPRWAPFTMRTLVIALLLSKFLFDTSRLTRTLT